LIGIIPEPHVLSHIAREEDVESFDAHGNHPVVVSPPVVRRAQCILNPTSAEVMSAEYAERIKTDVDMAVSDPTAYKAGDQVLLYGSIDGDGNYQGGVAYWVDGDPQNSRLGPWTQYYNPFGGLVHLKRVT